VGKPLIRCMRDAYGHMSVRFAHNDLEFVKQKIHQAIRKAE
jgi:hypothetical protein